MQCTTTLQFTKCEPDVIRHLRFLSDIKKSDDPKVVILGSDNLRISGSGQFGEENLIQLTNRIDEIMEGSSIAKWIIDLREEPHVFIGEDKERKPAVWKNDRNDVNRGKTTNEIIEDEDSRISQIGKTVWIKERKGEKILIEAGEVLNEKQLVERQGYHYFRLPITDRYKPTHECVENLVDFVVNHPNAWYHFHCYIGGGRTTTALAMVECLYFADEISFDDILYREKSLNGGSDLKKLSDPSELNFPLEKERLKLLKQFYLYCQEEKPLKNPQRKSWKEWIVPRLVKKAEALRLQNKLVEAEAKFGALEIEPKNDF